MSGVSSANVRQCIDAILANRIGEATGPWKKMVLGGASLRLMVVPMVAGALRPPHHATPSHGTSSVGLPVATGYALVVARVDGPLGPALTRVRSADSDAAQVRPPVRAPEALVVSPGEISADAIALPQLAALLARTLGRDVEDRSGLAGTFTVRLTWASEPGGSSLFTAFQQQLGLRLVPRMSDNQVDRLESSNRK